MEISGLSFKGSIQIFTTSLHTRLKLVSMTNHYENITTSKTPCKLGAYNQITFDYTYKTFTKQKPVEDNYQKQQITSKGVLESLK